MIQFFLVCMLSVVHASDMTFSEKHVRFDDHVDCKRFDKHEIVSPCFKLCHDVPKGILKQREMVSLIKCEEDIIDHILDAIDAINILRQEKNNSDEDYFSDLYKIHMTLSENSVYIKKKSMVACIIHDHLKKLEKVLFRTSLTIIDDLNALDDLQDKRVLLNQAIFIAFHLKSKNIKVKETTQAIKEFESYLKRYQAFKKIEAE